MKCRSPILLFEELVKSKALEKGRFLGLDVGDKYVGVSFSDDHNKIAMPGSVFLRKKTMIDLLAIDFQTVISHLSVVGLIVGCPLDKQKVCPDAEQVYNLISDLKATGKLAGVKFAYWNECFTSKNVEQIINHCDSHVVESKTMSDKFAAMGILQSYLDFVNRNKRLAALKQEWKNRRVESYDEVESDDEAESDDEVESDEEA